MSPVPETPAPARPTCGTCPYWQPDDAVGVERGECRKHAPRWISAGTQDWCPTKPTDWCGDLPAFPAFLTPTEAGTGRAS